MHPAAAIHTNLFADGEYLYTVQLLLGGGYASFSVRESLQKTVEGYLRETAF